MMRLPHKCKLQRVDRQGVRNSFGEVDPTRRATVVNDLPCYIRPTSSSRQFTDDVDIRTARYFMTHHSDDVGNGDIVTDVTAENGVEPFPETDEFSVEMVEVVMSPFSGQSYHRAELRGLHYG